MRNVGTFIKRLRSIDMKKIIILLSLLIPLSIFAAKDSFFARAGSDIVAYFNTYYNAKEYYKEAQELYEESEDKSKLQTKTRTALNQAVKQTDLVIEKFPNSSFIDDCIFMNSICQYQLKRYEKAIGQLEDLSLKYPDSPYYFEAKLWISKGFFQMDKKTIAYDLLEQFLSNSKNRPYFADAYSLMGYLALQENDSEKALDSFLKSAEQAYTKEDRCNMYLEAADIMILNENYDEALKLVNKASRSIKFDEQRARVQIAFTRAYRLLGKKAEAREIIKEAKLDARVDEYLGDIIYEEANIYFSDNSNERGVALLRSVVADKKYRNNKNSTAWVRSANRLGEYYLYQLNNMDSAKYFYNQAKLKRRQSEEGKIGERYLQKVNDIIKLEKALTNLAKNYPGLRDSAWVQFEILRDSTESELLKRELAYADTSVLDSAASDSLMETVKKTLFRYEKAKKAYVKNANTYVGNLYTLAGVFLFDLDMPDTALSIYQKIPKEYYFTSEIPKAIFSQSYVWEHVFDDKTKADSIKGFLNEKFPESEISHQILGKVPKDSILYYENQEKLYKVEKEYLDKGDYDFGLQALKDLMNSKDIDPRNHALIAYKLAWLYDNEISRSENTQDSTMKYYRIVESKHSHTPLASKSARRIAAIETDISDYLAFLAGDSLSTEDVNIDSSLYANETEYEDEESRKEHPILRRLKSPCRPRPARL